MEIVENGVILQDSTNKPVPSFFEESSNIFKMGKDGNFGNNQQNFNNNDVFSNSNGIFEHLNNLPSFNNALNNSNSANFPMNNNNNNNNVNLF